MKKALLLLCLITLVIGCKKEEPAPPPPPTPPPCQTGVTMFTGNYTFNGNSVEIKFLSNRCPSENSNYYLITGLGEAVKSILMPNNTFKNQVDTAYTENEPAGSALFSKEFNLFVINFINPTIGNKKLTFYSSKTTCNQNCYLIRQ